MSKKSVGELWEEQMRATQRRVSKRILDDEAIVLTDDERRLMVIALELYEEEVLKEKKEDGSIDKRLQRMLDMKKVLSSKLWGRC